MWSTPEAAPARERQADGTLVAPYRFMQPHPTPVLVSPSRLQLPSLTQRMHGCLLGEKLHSVNYPIYSREGCYRSTHMVPKAKHWPAFQFSRGHLSPLFPTYHAAILEYILFEKLVFMYHFRLQLIATARKL